jgi:hypothetical protein
MGRRGAGKLSTYAAALLAVALFAFAAVQSVVMQAVMAAEPDMAMSMADMPGMSMPMPGCPNMGAMQTDSGHGSQTDKGQAVCPYCAAAAHLPLCAGAPAIPLVSAVAWAAYTVSPSLGPRGPPALEPKARGPPETPLTL